jgi:hypothetical protein
VPRNKLGTPLGAPTLLQIDVKSPDSENLHIAAIALLKDDHWRNNAYSMCDFLGLKRVLHRIALFIECFFATQEGSDPIRLSLPLHALH